MYARYLSEVIAHTQWFAVCAQCSARGPRDEYQERAKRLAEQAGWIEAAHGWVCPACCQADVIAASAGGG